MVAMNHRMINTVVNRCKLPDDGDIIVPIRTVAVVGTTDVHVPDPDVYGIDANEIQFMLDEGEKLVPGFKQYRALRAWAGVRPLYKDVDAVSDRDIPRTYKLLDHAQRDGVEGIFSIVGGKWTTYRLMAEEAVDAIAKRLGNTNPCRTAEEILPVPATEYGGRQPAAGGGNGATRPTSFFWLGKPLADVERTHSYGDLICECELVTRERVIAAIEADAAANIDDIRRDVRLGMGPCQGGFCTYRAVALWAEAPSRRADADALAQSGALLRQWLQERWKGSTPVLWGDQLRQLRLDEIIYFDTLGIDLLEARGENEAAGPGMVTEHPAIATEYHKA
jgi:glycerol-3-phosphate dehydrogenase